MLLIYCTFALAEYLMPLSDGQSTGTVHGASLMKLEQEKEQAHLGGSAELWLLGSGSWNCQMKIQMIRHET